MGAAAAAGRTRTQATGTGPVNTAHLSMFCSTCQWQRLETVHTLVPERSHQPHAGRRTRLTVMTVRSALRRAGLTQTQEQAKSSRFALPQDFDASNSCACAGYLDS